MHCTVRSAWCVTGCRRMFELRAQEVKSHTDKSWIHVNCKIHGTHSPGTADQRKSPGTNQGHIGTSQSGKNKRTTLRPICGLTHRHSHFLHHHLRRRIGYYLKLSGVVLLLGLPFIVDFVPDNGLEDSDSGFDSRTRSPLWDASLRCCSLGNSTPRS